MYAKAVLTAAGDRPDWDLAPPDEIFVRHVNLATPSFIDAYFRDVQPDLSRRDGGGSSNTATGAAGGSAGPGGYPTTTFNYEKWVRTGTARKVTGDFSLIG